MIAVATVDEVAFVVFVRSVPGGGHVHHSARHSVSDRQGHVPVLVIRLKVVPQVVDDYVGALATEGVVGQPERRLHEEQGRACPGEGQPGVGSQVVDNFQQGGALVAVAIILRVDLDIAGQIAHAAGSGPRVHAVGDDAHLDPGAGEPAEGAHQVGAVDSVPLGVDRTGLGHAVVGGCNLRHRVQLRDFVQGRDRHPRLHHAPVSVGDLDGCAQVAELLQRLLFGVIEVDVDLDIV